MSLCPGCAEKSSAWLGFRLPPAPIQLMSIGDSVREVASRQESRYRTWRDTVNFQRDLIAQICQEGRCGRETA